MRPLSDSCPKPLMKVQGKPLMQWPMEALARAGQVHQLINTAWLGKKIADHFGLQPKMPGLKHVQLQYSNEGQDFGRALETAGGIVRALAQLDEVFWVIAGDIFIPEFDFGQVHMLRFAQSQKLAHLWLVPNPEHNPLGDFGLSPQGMALNVPKGGENHLYTFSAIALYRRAFFQMPACDIAAGNPQGQSCALAPLLRAAMDRGQVSAELFTGIWADVGTPKRLQDLNSLSILTPKAHQT